MNPEPNCRHTNLTNTYDSVLNDYQTQQKNTIIFGNQQQTQTFQQNNAYQYYDTNAIQYQNLNVNQGFAQQQFLQQPQVHQGQKHYLLTHKRLNTSRFNHILKN